MRDWLSGKMACGLLRMTRLTGRKRGAASSRGRRDRPAQIQATINHQEKDRGLHEQDAGPAEELNCLPRPRQGIAHTPHSSAS